MRCPDASHARSLMTVSDPAELQHGVPTCRSVRKVGPIVDGADTVKETGSGDSSLWVTTRALSPTGALAGFLLAAGSVAVGSLPRGHLPEWWTTLVMFGSLLVKLALALFLCGTAFAVAGVLLDRVLRRKPSGGRVCIAVGVSVAIVAGSWTGGLFEERSCESIAQQGSTIVAALESYRCNRGHYPSTLEHLAPQFLSRIPEPGTVAAGHFEYRALNSDGNGGTFLLSACLGHPIETRVLAYGPTGGRKLGHLGNEVMRVGEWVVMKN